MPYPQPSVTESPQSTGWLSTTYNDQIKCKTLRTEILHLNKINFILSLSKKKKKRFLYYSFISTTSGQDVFVLADLHLIDEIYKFVVYNQGECKTIKEHTLIVGKGVVGQHSSRENKTSGQVWFGQNVTESRNRTITSPNEKQLRISPFSYHLDYEVLGGGGHGGENRF